MTTKWRFMPPGVNSLCGSTCTQAACGVANVATASAMGAVHRSAQQRSAWRDADEIGAHLVDSIAIAVQRCTGLAVRASAERERHVMGAAAV